MADCPECGTEVTCCCDHHTEPVITEHRCARVFTDQASALVELPPVESKTSAGQKYKRHRVRVVLEWDSWWIPPLRAVVHQWKTSTTIEAGNDADTVANRAVNDERGRAIHWGAEWNTPKHDEPAARARNECELVVAREVLLHEGTSAEPCNRYDEIAPNQGHAIRLSIAAFEVRAEKLRECIDEDAILGTLRLERAVQEDATAEAVA